MSGFDNDIVFAKNADFTQADNQNVSESNGLVLDGQLWIGSTAINAGGTHINVGTLTSPNGSVTIGHVGSNITIQATNPTGVSSVSTTISGATVGFTPTTGNVVMHVTDANLNTLVGLSSGNLTLSGGNNTSLGYQSLHALTTGQQNTAIGWNSLLTLTTGQLNAAIGLNSGNGLTTGSQNTFLGNSTGTSYTGAETGNILVGFDTRGVIGESFVTRIGNAGNGGDTPQSACYIDGIYGMSPAIPSMVIINSSGLMGSQAITGGSVTITGDSGSISGNNLTIFANQNPTENAGSTVQFLATSGTTMTFNTTDASGNTMIGQAAGNLTTTGSVNTGIGFQALNVITSGVQNTAVGYDAMASLQGGVANTALGYSALASNVSGNFNTAVGDQSLFNCASSNNTAVGNLCFSGLNDANNVGIGYAVGASQTSGQNNTYVGMISGNLVVSGSNNSFLGYSSGSSFTTSDSNNISIGFGVTGSAGTSNEIRIGNSSNTTCLIQGISGVTVASAVPVVINSSGQLGTSTIGQTTVASVVSGSAVALTTATPTNITSISLIAGTYAISGIVNFTGAITVTGAQLASVNTTSATIGIQGNNAASSVVPTAGFLLGDNSVSIPSWILTIGSTTTVYLVAQATFSLGTGSAYGRISAVKVA